MQLRLTAASCNRCIHKSPATTSKQIQRFAQAINIYNEPEHTRMSTAKLIFQFCRNIFSVNTVLIQATNTLTRVWCIHFTIFI
jgi:hypothetical protein